MCAGLYASSGVSTRGASTSRSSGAMPNLLLQRPSLQRTWSGSSTGTIVEDEYAANTLQLTPALAEECSALVAQMRLPTHSSDAPVPEDSAMESSLNGAVSDAVYATPIQEPAAGEHRSTGVAFRSDSPQDTEAMAVSCADGAAGGSLPAIAEGSVPESSVAACVVAKHTTTAEEQCIDPATVDAAEAAGLVSPPPTHEPLLAPKAGVTVQHADGAAESLEEDRQRADPAAQQLCISVEPTVFTEHFSTQVRPAMVHEEGVAVERERVQSPDMFEDAVESLGTPSTGTLADLAATPSQLHPAVSVASQVSASMSPAQHVFTSASKPSSQRWKIAELLEQATSGTAARGSGAVKVSAADSSIYATPCAQSRVLDLDHLNMMDDSPTMRNIEGLAGEGDEFESHTKHAQVCSHVLDSFGTT